MGTPYSYSPGTLHRGRAHLTSPPWPGRGGEHLLQPPPLPPHSSSFSSGTHTNHLSSSRYEGRRPHSRCQVSSLARCQVSSLARCQVSSLARCQVSSLARCQVSRYWTILILVSLSRKVHRYPVDLDQGARGPSSH